MQYILQLTIINVNFVKDSNHFIFIWYVAAGAKISKYWPVPLTLELLNPKPIGFDRVSKTTDVLNFKSFRSGVFVLSCSHTHIPTPTQSDRNIRADDVVRRRE